MAHLQIEQSGESVTVSWHTINGRKVRVFSDRVPAERFALSRIGATGSIISLLDMSADDLADYRAREKRARAFMASVSA